MNRPFRPDDVGTRGRPADRDIRYPRLHDRPRARPLPPGVPDVGPAWRADEQGTSGPVSSGSGAAGDGLGIEPDIDRALVEKPEADTGTATDARVDGEPEDDTSFATIDHRDRGEKRSSRRNVQPREWQEARPDDPVAAPVERQRAHVGRVIAPWESVDWERVDEPDATDPGTGPIRRRADLTPDAPEPIAKELRETIGPRRGARLERALMEASKAYERQRYGDTLRMLRPLLDETPDVAAVQELAGLCWYRQGRWADAIRALERFAQLSGSVEQNPVLADCHRARGHHERVGELWAELGESSPNAELITEGRIVMAGSLADQGRVQDAIRLLQRSGGALKRPKPHHLRLWYAMADLCERAGEVPRARELFGRIAKHDPTFADVGDRLATL